MPDEIFPANSVGTLEAAAWLGVKPATIYAYVSRGLLPRLRADDRRSRFAVADLERFREGLGPDQRWLSADITRSALTSVRDGSLHFRGRDALELARTVHFEDAAEWLWTGVEGSGISWESDPEAVALGSRVQDQLPPDTLPLDRLHIGAAAIALTDPLRYQVRQRAAILSGRKLIAGLVESLPRLAPAAGESGTATPQTLTQRLWVRLTDLPLTPAAERAANASLVLLLDHDLSLSALAARMAATIGADPYAVVSVGLSALGAPFHSVASLAAEDLLREISEPNQAATVVGDRLRRGDRLPGFGHRLHPGGDPRASILLALLADCANQGESWEIVQAVIAVAARSGLPPPNIDFALAALVSVAQMVRGASEAIFGLARSAGWIAHAIDAYPPEEGDGAPSRGGPARPTPER